MFHNSIIIHNSNMFQHSQRSFSSNFMSNMAELWYTNNGGETDLKKSFFAVFILVFTLFMCSCSSSASKGNNISGQQNANGSDSIQASPSATVSEAAKDTSEPLPSLSASEAPASSMQSSTSKHTDTTEKNSVSDKERSWYYKPNKTHTVPVVPDDVKEILKRQDGYYVGKTSSKVLYLTFDEGYENGYTPAILDILKNNNVKAAFFVTRPYIKQQPDLIKRMVNEGHIVGNHSSTHPKMTSKTADIDSFNKEFTDTEKMFTQITGLQMPKYFRPPMGVYSEKSVELTKTLGYKTIFWSFAHKDWEVDNQPSVQTTHDRVLNGSHNGEIILLHAVSKSDTEALDSIIKDLKSQGYEFLSLDEL